MLRSSFIPAMVLACALGLWLLLAGCSGQTTGTAVPSLPEPAVQSAGTSGWPATLPVDGVQPWETVGADGLVTAPVSDAEPHSPSSINLLTEFVPGVERFLESGSVMDEGMATRIDSGLVDGKGLSYAVYRIPLGGQQPGCLALDSNQLPMNDGRTGPAWVGVSDYQSGNWQWLGSSADNHVRYLLPPGDYLSPLGNLFVAVVAYDGASCAVVGVGANVLDPADVIAPDAPAAPVLTPVAGGLRVEWLPVTAGDLAGYRVYYSGSDFTTPDQAGVKCCGYLEAMTRHYLDGLTAETFVRVTAVDTNGNESALSPAAAANPLAGTAPGLALTASQPDCLLGGSIQLTATGADAYDWDLDGDGLFETTGDTTGLGLAATSRYGLIRPRVRGSSGGGLCVAESAVSLIVSGNTRPVASGLATPASGPAPLSVTFSGTGEDFDGSISQYAWDYDGDGIYDYTDNFMPNPPGSHEYTTPGLYNAKFRVTDDLGAWDVDTVCILVETGGSGSNQAPTAEFFAYNDMGEAPLTVFFDAVDSFDNDGTIMLYQWDFNSDGSFEVEGESRYASWDFVKPGYYPVVLKVTDDQGATGAVLHPVEAHGWRTDDVIYLSKDVDSVFLLYGDGRPLILYGSSSTTEVQADVHAMVASDFRGMRWAFVPTTVLGLNIGPGQRLNYTAEMINGYATIAYIDEAVTPNALMYMVASTVDGGSWANPAVQIDASGNDYNELNLAEVGGNPALSYSEYLGSDWDVKYVRANDAGGATWGIPSIIVNTFNQEQITSNLAIIDGRPAIAFLDDTTTTWYFHIADDALGTTWWGTATSLGMSASTLFLGQVNDSDPKVVPALTYYDTSAGYVRLMMSQDAVGGTWDAPIDLAQTGQGSAHVPLLSELGTDKYTVTYINYSLGQVYAINNVFQSSYSWAGPREVCQSTETSEWYDVEFIYGKPAIVTVDQEHNSIKYSRLY